MKSPRGRALDPPSEGRPVRPSEDLGLTTDLGEYVGVVDRLGV
jgi:hypothetical protein